MMQLHGYLFVNALNATVMGYSGKLPVLLSMNKSR